jgi:GNAT superfamily N-acetyltransferase
MAEQLESLYIATVASKDAELAYRFHERIAKTEGSHLWARTEDEIKNLIADGSLFGLWVGEEKQLVGLCYATLADNESSWEIGGLTVDDAVKKRGIGSILLRFTLAHTIVYQLPWNNGQTLIAHVHEVNDDPRGIINKLGFKHLRRFEVPESANPPKWMKRNAEGKVVGDEFEFPPEGLNALTAWFHEDLEKMMQQRAVEFGFGYAFNLDDFKADLREISDSI